MKIKISTNKKQKESSKVAKAVMLKGKKVLLLKRSRDSNWMPEKWAIPGGHIEEGESSKDAAIRETKEETNLDISNIRELKKQEQVIIYYSDSQSGVIRLDFEHTDWAWVSYDELDNYDTTPGLKKIVRMALEKIK